MGNSRRRRHQEEDQAAKPRRVALYARVSSEEQAERGTIQNQLTQLRGRARLEDWDVADEYIDDGVSGTIPLEQRTQGGRLVADGHAGKFSQVVVLKVDRLARSLDVLTAAHRALDNMGVAILSATEPFDTSTAVGKMLFQLLGTFAEFEKASISERMTRGRDRMARTGRWTGGPIPFGYEIGGDATLAPSRRIVETLGVTEAEVAVSIFDRIAAGSTTVAECRRLNAAKVPTWRRYGSGKIVTVGGEWRPSRINAMVKNPLYAGRHVFKSRHGNIERPVSALVDQDVWERVQAQLARNRSLPLTVHGRQYLLRGLVKCGLCGRSYSGFTGSGSAGSRWRGNYYRCTGQSTAIHPDRTARCKGKMVPAEYLEDLIWQDCAKYCRQPDDALAELQAELKQRRSRLPTRDVEAKRLESLLLEKQAEKDRVLVLYRRGSMAIEDTEAQLGAIDEEREQLQTELAGLRAEAEIVRSEEAYLDSAEAVLLLLGQRITDIERIGDVEAKRQIVGSLVSCVRIDTSGEGHRKTYRISVKYHFPADRVDLATSGSGVRSRRTG